MKKITLVIGILLAARPSLAMIVTQQQEWRKNFKNIDHGSITKLLGFDPAIELIEDNNLNVIHQCPTVYFHGWLSGKTAHRVIKRCENSNTIPGDKIIFNFQDASTWFKLPAGISEITGIKSVPILPPNLFKSNLAQTDDILTGIVILKALYDVNIKNFVLYGHSRGGGTICSLIGFLNQAQTNLQSHEYHTLQQLNITQNNCTNLLSAIKVVYLDCPLKDVKTALAVHPWASFLPTSLLEKTIIPTLSQYNSEKPQPIDYVKDWPKNIPVLFHTQYNDSKVSNIDDGEFAKKLLTHNSTSTYIIPGNDGGHDQGYKTISQSIHTINSLHNGSYVVNQSEQNKKNLTVYDKNNVEQHLKSYYDDQAKKLEPFIARHKKKLFVFLMTFLMIVARYKSPFRLFSGMKLT